MPASAFRLAALALALAGCAAPVADVPPVADALAPWWELALGSDHDHTDPHLHPSTPNFATVGWSPLVSEHYGTTVQGNLCGDAQETADGRRLAVVETRGDVAFSIADVTDPTAPQWLGEFVMATTFVYDLAVVPDGKHVVLVTSNHKTPDRAPALKWRSPCAEGGMERWQDVPLAPAASPVDAVLPRPTSLLLVSIEDPGAPEIVDQRPLGGYGHGVSAADADGRLLVAAAALACPPRTGCLAPAESYHFLEVAHGPLGARLEALATYTLPVDKVEAVRTGHNDVWVAKHPGTGQWLAWLAAWDNGLFVLDVDDPTAPRLVGHWTDYDAAQGDDDTGSVHSVHPLPDLRDGRHYTLVGPEIVGHPTTLPTGVVRVLDTTDPARPFDVAAWTLPLDVVWEERLQFSTHYLTAHEDTAFVSTYHGGVWALDLSGVRADAFTVLPSVGVYMPNLTSPAPPATPMRWAPTVEEVHAFPDGTLVTFDSNTGLYAFRFDAAAPAPAPPTPWRLEQVVPS